MTAIKQLIKRALGRPEIQELLLSAARNEIQSKISGAYSRAALTRSLVDPDPLKPDTWEFSAFCQHGEDGIIDFLVSKLNASNQYFVEIGAGDGTQNNSAWLAFVRAFDGLMIDRNSELKFSATAGLQQLNYGVQYVCEAVDIENVRTLVRRCPFADPDVFSLDIDGIDYHIAQSLLQSGFRPKIVAVEYNCALGDTESITVPYKPNFDRHAEHSSKLYYGVSIMAWKEFWKRYDYEFVTVNSSGVNAFFVRRDTVSSDWLARVEGTPFRMNFKDQNAANVPSVDANGDPSLRRLNWREQFELVKDLPFLRV